MARWRYIVLLAAAVCGSVLSGCGPLQPHSPEMFYGTCIMVPGRDLCGSDQEICQVYQTVVTDKHASAAACREACNQADRQLSMQYLCNGCDGTIGRGNDLCLQQCLRLFP